VFIVLFRNRPHPKRSSDEYNKTAGRMLHLVSKMPGFVSLDVFNNDDGETLIYGQFETDEALVQWREHAEHKEAQGRRDEFYEEYSVQVCEVIRAYSWRRDDTEWE
jgi:heme-degrading monooxygenase HmoA